MIAKIEGDVPAHITVQPASPGFLCEGGVILSRAEATQGLKSSWGPSG